MKTKAVFAAYLKIVFTGLLLLLGLRFCELLLVSPQEGLSLRFLKQECLGVLFDAIIANTLFIILFPFYFICYKGSEIFARLLFVIVFIVLAVAHFIALKYFQYQLMPLDTFLFNYSFKEISYTIGSSNLNFGDVPWFLLTIVAMTVFSFVIIQKIKFSKKALQLGYTFVLLSLPLFFLFKLYRPQPFDKYSMNKSYYFYARSLSFYFSKQSTTAEYSLKDVQDFHNLDTSKIYLSDEFPLLHTVDTANPLKPFFRPFKTAPNIVLLIVEGLNDDFIHPFKGVNFMPFLNSLKDKSLYWNRCFTLGERSFAATPCLLGSLPYGEKGFTLLDQYPKHFSLVSILKSNGYYTSFYYGQGSWFHKKDLFFNYNTIDLIVDNKKFSGKYTKIITGKDNFFWGYNDKDLLNQSLEVMNTLPIEKRLDIFFTGTSHSPFVITNENHYKKLYNELTEKGAGPEQKKFFNNYSKYLKTLPFVDDALKDFFEKYSKRPEYKNTIFIITGDHPMTEVPPTNLLKRFHVPLIIFSPGGMHAHTFTQTVSHLDFYASILSLLKDYKIKAPDWSATLGNTLNVSNKPSHKSYAFMNGNREIIDYYSNPYYLSGNQLYSVDANLSLKAIENKVVYTTLLKQLNAFKKTSLYVSLNDKIVPDTMFSNYLKLQVLVNSRTNKDLVHVQAEYQDLIQSRAVRNKPLHYEISFDYNGLQSNAVSVVLQVATKKDSVLFWNSFEIKPGEKKIKKKFDVPVLNIKDSIVFIKSFFWNQSKKEYTYSNMNIFLYQDTTKKHILSIQQK
jgi:phosphoglycerol transferase MdoB-like AlkP superfamily enzyme